MIFTLNNLKSKGLIFCCPSVDALLSGMNKIVRALLEDVECQIVVFYSRFRFILLNKNNSKVAEVKEDKVEEAMRQQSYELSNKCGSSNNEGEENDFFSDVTQTKENNKRHNSLTYKALNLVKPWLETKPKDLLTDGIFMGERVLVDLSIKFNTAIPSCAAVKNLFPMVKDILRVKR